MTRIAVTQRVAVDPSHGERRDCLDQRWLQMLEGLGVVMIPVPNGLSDVGQWAAALGVEGVILSGGNSLSHLFDAPDTAPERDLTERQLLDWAKSTLTPVLGVCRGMQMMNCYLGGSLEPISGHAGTRHQVQTTTGPRQVNSYHNYAVTEAALASDVDPTAWDEAGHIEAFSHSALPWIAMMWHPEREAEPDEHDTRILQTHLKLGKPWP